MSRAPAALALLPALLVGVPAAAVFIDGPPPSHTGGFGEPTCAACHFDVAEPDPAGALTLEGLPEAYAPGARYPLTLRLHRPGMARGGFQLAARFADGAQAGALRGTGPRAATTREGGIDYAHNTREGAEPDTSGAAVWTVEWTAPAEPAGPVVLHFAGSAADGDESQFGDHVYSGSARVPVVTR